MTLASFLVIIYTHNETKMQKKAVRNTKLTWLWKTAINEIVTSYRLRRMKNVSNECVNAAKLYVTEWIQKSITILCVSSISRIRGRDA